MSKRTILIISALVVISAAWYLFRPERLFVNARVNEDFPATGSRKSTADASSPVKLAVGSFHDGAHKTTGTATIHQLPDGNRVLRLTNFETSNGPDVRVYLVAAQDATDNETVTRAGFLELGSLKGNIGDQNYAVPADADLGRYKSVTIWCKRFGVNFGTAPLTSRS
jgi:electron transfer DM13